MTQTGTFNNPIVDYLKKKNIPVTEDNYLSLAYIDVPKESRTQDMINEWRIVDQTIKEGW